MAAAGPSTLSSTSYTPKELTLIALQANTNHQYALEKYTERLTAELQECDRLLDLADGDGSDQDIEDDIEIPGAVKPTGPIPMNDFLNPESPFYEDSVRRSRYVNFINPHPMKARELEALTDAVTGELRRLQAVDSRRRGLGIPSVMDPVDLNGDVEKVDWVVVSEKVSDVSAFKRTAEECKIKWLGHRRPIIDHSEWKPEELERLKGIVAERQSQRTLDWVKVAEDLGTNRTPIDCMRNGIARARHNWNPDYDQKLLEGVELYGVHNWSLVALHVSEHATANQCQMRYTRTLDPSLKKGVWTQEEDERLTLAYAALGPNWVDVAVHVPGRTNEQCRERYQDHINPTVKRVTAWSDAEDEQLIEAVKELGHKWKKISELMGNKHSEAQCRSRYSKIRKIAPTTSNSITFSEHLAKSSSSQEDQALTKGREPDSSSGNSNTPTVSQGSTSLRFISVSAEAPVAKPKPKPKGKQRQVEVPKIPGTAANRQNKATSVSEVDARTSNREEPIAASALTSATEAGNTESAGMEASLQNHTLSALRDAVASDALEAIESASRSIGSGADPPDNSSSALEGADGDANDVIPISTNRRGRRGGRQSSSATHATPSSPSVTRRSARLAGRGSERSP